MKRLRLKTSCKLQASTKGRRFKISGYDGGKLNVANFDLPVAIDLRGLETPPSIPCLINHDDSIESTLGSTDTITNNGSSLELAGAVTGKSVLAKTVLEQADGGHSWQASVGCDVDPSTLETVAAGRTTRVNNRSITGPCYVARNAILKEISVVSSGAAKVTSVNLSAKSKGSIMTFEEFIASLGITDLDSLTDQGREFLKKQYAVLHPPGDASTSTDVAASAHRGAILEARRIAGVERIAAGHPDIADQAISEGWDLGQTKDRVELKALRAGRSQPGAIANGYGIDRSNGPQSGHVLSASLSLSCGANPKLLAKAYGEQTVDAAMSSAHRGASLHSVMEATIRADGRTPPSHRVGDGFIRAAFESSRNLQAAGYSTLTLPGILGDAANKLLLEGFQMVKDDWREFTAIGDMKDFKPSKRFRLVASGSPIGGAFAEVGRNGELNHLNASEETYENQLKTYGNLIQISRQNLIDDDLGAFDSLPKSLGRLAAIKLQKTIYGLLLANGGSFFHANNSNYLDGAGSALDIAALSAAEQLFLTRTDGNGDPLLLTPEILLVPPTLSVTGNQLVRDVQTVAIGVGDTASLTPSGNPHSGKFTPIVSPFLENAQLSGYSAAGWYLLARAQGSSGLIEVGFLNGQQSPIIESGDLSFELLGIGLRGYWDFGVALQDGRFGVFNVGS